MPITLVAGWPLSEDPDFRQEATKIAFFREPHQTNFDSRWPVNLSALSRFRRLPSAGTVGKADCETMQVPPCTLS